MKEGTTMFEDLLIGLRGHAKRYGCDDRCPCYDTQNRGYATCSEELAEKAADAIEELSRAAEQSKRELEAILPWFGEFLMDMDEDGLKEIVEAKREDRLIILPVTSGTPIFCDGVQFASHCAGEIHEVTDWRYSYPMIQKYFCSELDYELDPDEYNRSWFTDRKKCENYLNRKYHRESEVGRNDGV